MIAKCRPLNLARRRAPDGPALNISDVPEMMRGAEPSANSVARDRFNQRCKSLWRDAEEEKRQESDALAICRNNDAMERYSQLESMFPNLDPELVWSMCQETSSMQDVVDALLTVSISSDASSGADIGDAASSARPSNDNVNEDTCTQQKMNPEAWPTLIGSDGWEVVNLQTLQQEEKDLGNAWCTTAKDAVSLPAPKPAAKAPAKATRKEKEKVSVTPAMDVIEEDAASGLDEYNVRHSIGRSKAFQLAQKAAMREMIQPIPCAGPVARQQHHDHLLSESDDTSDFLSDTVSESERSST